MAKMNSENLVLRGVNVVADVVIGLKRIGSGQANDQTAAMPLSCTRHLMMTDSRPDADPAMRYEPATSAASSAQWAGRPGYVAGVLSSRNPAITAGRAILSGWSLVEGGACPAAVGISGRFTALMPMPAGEVLPGRTQLTRLHALRPWRLSPSVRSGKRGEVSTAYHRPAGGTPSASTRGKGAR